MITSCSLSLSSFITSDVSLFNQLFSMVVFLVLECFSFDLVLLDSCAEHFFLNIAETLNISSHQLITDNLDYILDSATTALRYNQCRIGTEFVAGLFKLITNSEKSQDFDNFILPFLLSFGNEILNCLPQSEFKNHRDSLLRSLYSLVKPLFKESVVVDWRNLPEESCTKFQKLLNILIEGVDFMLDSPSFLEKCLTLDILYCCFSILSHDPFNILQLIAKIWNSMFYLITSDHQNCSLKALKLIELFLMTSQDFAVSGNRLLELISSLDLLLADLKLLSKNLIFENRVSSINSILSLLCGLDLQIADNLKVVSIVHNWINIHCDLLDSLVVEQLKSFVLND
ncbi:hypothetical protein GEMRC1_012626 [Eukaryota sp. GEM-RC1]